MWQGTSAYVDFVKALVAPFGVILEVLGVQMGPCLKGFGGLVPSLGALGAQFAPGPPGVFHGPPF